LQFGERRGGKGGGRARLAEAEILITPEKKKYCSKLVFALVISS
jgi:hypothetical protein